MTPIFRLVEDSKTLFRKLKHNCILNFDLRRCNIHVHVIANSMCVHLEYLKVHITCFSCVKNIIIKTIPFIVDLFEYHWCTFISLGNNSLSEDENVKILKGVKQFAAWDIILNCLNVFTFLFYSGKFYLYTLLHPLKKTNIYFCFTNCTIIVIKSNVNCMTLYNIMERTIHVLRTCVQS